MAAHLRKLYLRNISTSGGLRESLAEPLTQNPNSHHERSYLMWRKIFLLVCCPALALGFINVSLADEPPLPEFKKYPHLRIRKKPFPWGDGQKSLFHNSHTNALPDGYEHQH